MIASHICLSAGADGCEGSRQVKPALPAFAKDGFLEPTEVADSKQVRRCARGLTGVTQCEDQQRYEQVS
jgi:hypothetical protein